MWSILFIIMIDGDAFLLARLLAALVRHVELIVTIISRAKMEETDAMATQARMVQL